MSLSDIPSSVWKVSMFFLLLGLALAQVWLGYVRVELSQQREILQRQIRLEHTEISKLSLEYANLTRPEHLRRLAHEKLGMHAPKPEQLIQW